MRPVTGGMYSGYARADGFIKSRGPAVTRLLRVDLGPGAALGYS